AAGTTPTGLNVVRNPQTGFLDLLVGNPFGDVLRLRGRGDGTFGPPGSRVALAVQPDLLGPGRPGVLLTNQQADPATVQAPASAGQFVKVQTLDASAPTDGQPARLDRNSPFYDLVVASSGSNAVLVYRGTGFDAAGHPTYAAPASYSVGTDPVS